MNIYFSGIGGVGIGPLAELAQDAGHTVQGSDPSDSATTRRLAARGIAINQKQKGMFLQACHGIKPIDWFVYSSAVPEDHPELVMARLLGIKTTKRDEFLSMLLDATNLKLVAIAGTHGKTTTTSMIIWAMKQLGVPVSYCVGSPLSFGPSGKFDHDSTFFVYECDEYDRNFLKFRPHLALITSLDYDHPDTYGSPAEYLAAFQQFLNQSEGSIIWQSDSKLLDAHNSWLLHDDEKIDFALGGLHNRRNATLVAKALERMNVHSDVKQAIESFPGVSRRFEKLQPGIYTDYGHHPTEIAATLQLAREISDNVVLVYQPHQNIRQHHLRTEYTDCFELAETVYWLPTYLTREDPTLAVLTADELTENITNLDSIYTADLDDELWETVQKARDEGKLVLFMGAGSVDDWAREHCEIPHIISILVTDTEGNFVLHHGQKADQSDGDSITGFSGDAKSGDSSLSSRAAEILRESVTLSVKPDDLSLFKLYANSGAKKSYTAYYVLSNVDKTNLKAKPGISLAIIDPNHLREQPLSIFTRTVITEYTHPPMIG